jgi:outer membrane murein-binding lipoprotein Lpp
MPARTVAWLSAAALLCGCVTVPEFRALEREVSDLKAGRGSGGAGPLPDGRLAELGSEVSELRDEVARLRGAIEETRNLAQEAMARAELGGATRAG